MPSFPVIKTSGDAEITTGLPYSESDEFPVVSEELECGKAYALNWYTGPQPRVFTRRFTTIERAELTILEDFFREMRGRLGTFDCEDNEGVVWPKCRFDQDDLRVEYVGVNQFNVEVKIRAIRFE
jgi:hypothetical protein